MGRCAKLLALSAPDQWLLARAFAGLLFATAAVRLLPFTRLKRWLLSSAAPRPRVRAHCAPERIIWAVATASPYVWGATCLPQALAARALLRRAGHATALHLGVRKDESGHIQAHAWLEHHGEVLLGGPVAHYSEILATAD
jgi:hypothetical protein